MNLKILEQAGPVARSLHSLCEQCRIYSETPAQDRNGSRFEIATSISEAVDSVLGDNEKERVADVLIELVIQAEKDLKQAIAERLSGMENAPLRLILLLSNDEISVAGKVLKKSPVLNDLDLLYIIRSHGPDYWQCIAQRESLSSVIVDTLSETRDRGTARCLVANDTTTLTEKSLSIFVELAQTGEDLAKPLLQRKEIPPALARRLYEYVGEELKKYIEETFKPDEPLKEQINSIVEEFSGQPTGQQPTVTQDMLAMAQSLREQEKLSPKLILSALRKGQSGFFVALLARYTNLNPSVIGQILGQNSGQGLAIACRATDISREDFIAMFILTQSLWRGGGAVNAKVLGKAIAYFNKITPSLAQRLLKDSAPFQSTSKTS